MIFQNQRNKDINMINKNPLLFIPDKSNNQQNKQNKSIIVKPLWILKITK